MEPSFKTKPITAGIVRESITTHLLSSRGAAFNRYSVAADTLAMARRIICCNRLHGGPDRSSDVKSIALSAAELARSQITLYPEGSAEYFLFPRVAANPEACKFAVGAYGTAAAFSDTDIERARHLTSAAEVSQHIGNGLGVEVAIHAFIALRRAYVQSRSDAEREEISELAKKVRTSLLRIESQGVLDLRMPLSKMLAGKFAGLSDYFSHAIAVLRKIWEIGKSRA